MGGRKKGALTTPSIIKLSAIFHPNWPNDVLMTGERKVSQTNEKK